MKRRPLFGLMAMASLLIFAAALPAAAPRKGWKLQKVENPSFMGVDSFVHKRQREDLDDAPSHNPQLSPYHTDNATTLLETGACSAGVKTGYWIVGCYVDKKMDPNRVWYNDMVPQLDRLPMTPQVCFDFCKVQYGMRYFFIGDRKEGDGCSCGRFYAKSVKGDMGQCDHPCEGDASQMCGGHYKESTYQMHDCKSAMRKPLKPWEFMGLRVELMGPNDGVRFFSGSEEIPQGGSPEDKAIKAHPNWLIAMVLDPHDAFVKSVATFNIEGEPKTAGEENDQVLAKAEAGRFNAYIAGLEPLDIILVTYNSAPNHKNAAWGAEIEEALRSMGMPGVSKPKNKFGYAGIAAAHVDMPQSPVLPDGHVAAYIYNKGSMENQLVYMIDCEVGDYADKGDCSVSCGGGQQFQQRIVIKEPAHGGRGCPPDFERYVPCNPDPCPVDCAYSEWSGFGACMPECGPGTQVKQRTIIVQPQYGGVQCNEELEIERSCTVGPCPIDCVFGEWKQWSTCDAQCGEGNQARKRSRKVLPKFGGMDCEGPYIQEQSCIVRPCPVDCEVGEWGPEGDCGTSCGPGLQLETRPVLVAAAHGGGECPPTERHVPCNKFPCPIDCVVSEWTETECGKTCGGGRLTKSREITTKAQFGGMRCPRSLQRVMPCNVQRCPIDGVWAEWSNWGRCSTTCGPGVKIHRRYKDVEAMYGGLEAEGPEEEEMECEVTPCPIDCKWADWKDWSDCSMECGPGRHNRDRVIATHNEYGGIPCEGPEKEEEKCEKKPCPVACEVGEWKDIGECSKRCGGGQQMQVREILSEAAHGGTACPPLEQFVECNGHPCPVDCEMTPWQDNGPCSVSCGAGDVAQKRFVLTKPLYGGFKCPTINERETACNTQPCPVDGVWGEWTGWSGCSNWCGPGTTSRMRNKLVIALHGGKEAEGLEREVKECEDRPCPINCEWDQWGDWGDCSAGCGVGKSERSRPKKVQAQFGGIGCEGPEDESKECIDQPCPVECEVSAWEEEGECSLTCGGGVQKKVRHIRVEALFGGTPCPSNLEKEDPCNGQQCPVDCELSDWTEASECDVSCGGGVLSEIKTVVTQPAFGGSMCDVVRSREVECNSQPCPIDCEWDAWTGWTSCSTTCDPGHTKRRRAKYQDAAHGGVECTGPEEVEEECEVVPCPVHCEFSEWSEWSECDEECGEGSQERSRFEATKEDYGGAPCTGPTFEEQVCKVKDCPVDCKVSNWKEESGCNKHCGGGSYREVRTIEVAVAAGGEECPTDLIRDLPCNTQPCPVDCDLEEWEADGSCTVTCGGGVQKMTRAIKVQPSNGGRACHPERQKYVTCGEEVCPVDCLWSQWSGWSPCNTVDPRACGTGEQKRSHVILIESAGAGKSCDGPFAEVKACELAACPVDGKWGPWEAWEDCDEECGPGWHTRTRPLDQAPMMGGIPAPGPRSETERCKVRECAVDCKVSSWKLEGECSHTCGTEGLQKQLRSIATEAAHGGAECPATLEREVPCNIFPCPVDCVLSEWADQGECTSSCGGGTVYQKRNIQVAAAHNGKNCDAPLMQFVECNTDPCPIDCQWGVWSGWGACSETCGEGHNSRSRVKSVEAQHGGDECEGDDIEEAECEVVPCPVDCEWDEWGEFGECDSECGPGEKVKERSIKVEAAYGGNPCEGANTEVEECEDKPCPVDCEVSDWRTTGTCSESCGGGVQTQQRQVMVPMQNDGEPCPGDLIRDHPCNLEPCPIDCAVSDWEDKTDCTVTCGGGTNIQIRERLVRPRYGGVPCPSGQNAYMQTVACGDTPCPVHCAFTEWDGWSVCSHTCGGGKSSRTREVSVEAENGGEECQGAFSEEAGCNVSPCPVDGVWNDWSAWSDCSELCGPGFQERTRSSAVEPAFGGYPLIGAATESRECETRPCPVDCILSDWQELHPCDVSCGGGQKHEERYVTKQPKNGAEPCPSNLVRYVPCNEFPCPVDCQVDFWKKGDCSKSCGGGSVIRERKITQAPMNGGVECPEYLPMPKESCELITDLEVECGCNEQPCPIDCLLEQWSTWGECSKTCGKGKSKRTRIVKTDAEHGGEACPSGQKAYEESQDCFLSHCPVHGEWGEWSTWGTCSQSCGDGFQTRFRDLQVAPAHGGEDAPGDATATRECIIKDCPVHCEVGPWMDAGTCSKSCGTGKKAQNREVVVAPGHGGSDCPKVEQTVPCNPEPCPVDCVMTPWAPNGDCSKSCGTGRQVFLRTVEVAAEDGGVACPPQPWSKEEDCNTDECPVDCVLSEWTAWSSCSATCNEGTSERTRTITTESAHGGVSCPPADQLAESRQCKLAECPVHCVLSDWGEWGECSKSCGAGTWTRSRTIEVEPQHGAPSCEKLMDDPSECTVQACPVDCVVSAWAPSSAGCSKSCGDGILTMERTITTEPTGPGAKPCGDLEKTVPCFEGGCPQHCEVSEWANDGSCSKVCGTGQQLQKKIVLMQPANGGEPCPPAEEMENLLPCNDFECPAQVVGEAGTIQLGKGETGSVPLNVKLAEPVVVLGAFSPPLTEVTKSAGSEGEELLQKDDPEEEEKKPFAHPITCGITNVKDKKIREAPKLEGEIRAKVDDSCIDYNFNTDKVGALDCTANANQEWQLQGGSLKSLHDGRCLTFNATDGSAGMSDCGEAEEGGPLENQSWAFTDGQLQTKVDKTCMDYDAENGKVKMKPCENKLDQSFYFETLGNNYNTLADVEIGGDANLEEYDSLDTCRLECYSRPGCCGFTLRKNGKCVLKDAATKCAPVTERDGAKSFVKTGDVSNLYATKAGLSPDTERGAKVVSGGALTGKDACTSECYKDKDCCGFVELPDLTCKLFKECDPLEPAFGSTFFEKTSGEEEKTKMSIGIKCEGLSLSETADVPWFACDAGIYKTTEGKMMQCGVADVQNSGDTWTEVPFHEDFPGTPVLVAYTMTQEGGQSIRARVKGIAAGKFEASLELPTSGTGVQDASTGLEKMGWIAIESGKGIVGGKKYFAEEASGVDGESGKVEFPKDYFTAPPKIVAAVASVDGTSTVGVQMTEVSTEKVELRLAADKEDDTPSAEKVGVLALESPSMAGAALSASLVARPKVEMESDFEPPVLGKIIAPASDATLSGPFQDLGYCLTTCKAEEECCGVVTIPSGYCWLKSSHSDCSLAGASTYPGAESYAKKAGEASLLTKGAKQVRK